MAYRQSTGKVARPKYPLVVVVLCTVGVLAVTASASILQAQLTQSTSKRVLFNVFSWQGFELDLLFRQLHEAEALDVIRSALLEQKKIGDLPVLVRGEGPRFEKLRNNRSSIEDACGVYPDGEAETENLKSIGPCYLIHLAKPESYQDLLAMTVALSSLSSTRRHIEVTDAGAFRTTWSTAMLSFKGLVEHFDPIWSPDARWLLYTVWEDGQVWFALMDPVARTTRRLPLLGYMNTRPVWSPDSRWVAYTSRKEIRLYDTKTETERRLLPSAMNQPEFKEVVLTFQDANLAILLVEPQVNLWEYAYDVTRNELRQVRIGGTFPRWAEDTWRESPVALHASLRQTLSPTGRYVAQIRVINGRRVLEVSPRQ